VRQDNVDLRAHLETQVLQAHRAGLAIQVTSVVKVRRAVPVLLVSLDRQEQKDSQVQVDLGDWSVPLDPLDSLEYLVSLLYCQCLYRIFPRISRKILGSFSPSKSGVDLYAGLKICHQSSTW